MVHTVVGLAVLLLMALIILAWAKFSTLWAVVLTCFALVSIFLVLRAYVEAVDRTGPAGLA